MLDHEEKFLFKEEILHLSNAVAEPGILDNVEDLLTDVITSPRFDSEVFTLERSLQVMLGPRAGPSGAGCPWSATTTSPSSSSPTRASFSRSSRTSWSDWARTSSRMRSTP